MKDQLAGIAPPLVVMLLAVVAGKLHTTFFRVAAEVRDVSEYSTLGARVINNSTPAVTFEEMLNGEEAAHIISLARPRMQPANVFKQLRLPGLRIPSGGVQKARISGRTNTAAWLTHDETSIVQEVVDRISATVGIPSSHAEALQVIRYTDGQEYKAHVDGYEDAATHLAGQRLLTALVYLTSVPEHAGGSTKLADHEIQPEVGRLLIFHNCHGKTNIIDQGASHAALPVRGDVEKWAFNLWYHEYRI